MRLTVWRGLAMALAKSILVLSGFALSGFALQGAAAEEVAAYRAVTIPNVGDGPLCADEKAELVSRVASAQADAAENVQIATRHFALIQAAAKDGKLTAGDVDIAARERDTRLEEARKAFAALDKATRVTEKKCASTKEAAVPPSGKTDEKVASGGKAEEQPKVQSSSDATSGQSVVEKNQPPASPAAAAEKSSKPDVSLALAFNVPGVCKPGSTCPMAVELSNNGTKPLPSPFLVAFALGGEASETTNILPDSWTCGQAKESLTCSGAGTAIEPGGKVQLSIDWQIPEHQRRPSATVCARIVWPARAKDGVYRSEQIAAIQFALKKAGFDPGLYDGRLGAKTVDAIRSFRARAGIEGPTELTNDFLTALFGPNGALSGDDDAANDSACKLVSFGNSPVASEAPKASAPVTVVSVPPTPSVEASPPAPEKPKLDPAADEAPKAKQQVTPREPRRRQQAAIPVQPRRPVARRAPAPADEDDDADAVIVYTSPPRGTVSGGTRPVIVNPDGTYRRWGDSTLYRR